jgi:ATP-dependent RNA helicase RhlE
VFVQLGQTAVFRENNQDGADVLAHLLTTLDQFLPGCRSGQPKHATHDGNTRAGAGRTADPKARTDWCYAARRMPFLSLGLSEPLAQAAQAAGYASPTPVQHATIPQVLTGGDVWVSAQTGSGKTAAYVLPLCELLAHAESYSPRLVRVLVLVPTRELAAQVSAEFIRFASALSPPLKTCCVVGGVSENPQMLALRGGADAVVATPGRLLDLVRKNALSLHEVRALVIDEADRMFALGFADELDAVLALLPTDRQTLLVSATFPASVQRLAHAVLHDPTRIEIQATAAAPVLIRQRAIEVDLGKRTLLLRHLLTTHDWSGVLVFVASRLDVLRVTTKLKNAGVVAAGLHGDLSQGARTNALAQLNARSIHVLVATDVAARGIDIPLLPAVVNYDLPRSPVDYVHRIGRTGRAGEPGVAISFVTAANESHFALIERRQQFYVAREQIEGFERTEFALPNTDPSGGIKGKKPNKKDKLRALNKASVR